MVISGDLVLHSSRSSEALGSSIPVVPGRAWLGNTVALTRRPLGFFIDAYHAYGPVFRIDAPMTRPLALSGRVHP